MVRSLSDHDLDESDRKLLQDITRVGWHVVLIPEESSTPGWGFSVGLFHSYKHPEIVVFGLSLELSGQVINAIGGNVKAGQRFEDGQEYPGILEGVFCRFRPVEKQWYRPFLGYAQWYYKGSKFPVLQCLWPDKQQNYPWEPDFRKSWLSAQPLLYETRPEAARIVPLLETMNGE